MKPLRVAALLVAGLACGSPSVATAQEPERAPRPAPQPTVAPPPDTAAPRDVAVPRQAAPPPQVAAPRSEAPRSDAPRVETPSNANAEEGSRRRERLGATNSAPSASASAEDGQRRGSVRRPPSSGSGGGTAPRDQAVARTGPPPRDWDDHRGHHRYVYYYPSYFSYGRYYDPYYYSGFHLGYLAYGPWGWTPAFYGYPYGAGYSPGYASGYDMGRLRLKVKPRDAEVWVDGYYAGTVDDFDGNFQALRLETGGYKIEVRKPGFETLTFDVHVQPDRTITYRGDMHPQP